PNDVVALFNLARAHAMAYALRTETLEVRKNNENEGAWFGYAPAHVPFTVKPTNDSQKIKAAREHLTKAIEFYQRVLELAPDNLPAALGHAWCVEQSGNKRR